MTGRPTRGDCGDNPDPDPWEQWEENEREKERHAARLVERDRIVREVRAYAEGWLKGAGDSLHRSEDVHGIITDVADTIALRRDS